MDLKLESSLIKLFNIFSPVSKSSNFNKYRAFLKSIRLYNSFENLTFSNIKKYSRTFSFSSTKFFSKIVFMAKN